MFILSDDKFDSILEKLYEIDLSDKLGAFTEQVEQDIEINGEEYLISCVIDGDIVVKEWASTWYDPGDEKRTGEYYEVRDLIVWFDEEEVELNSSQKLNLEYALIRNIRE